MPKIYCIGKLLFSPVIIYFALYMNVHDAKSLSSHSKAKIWIIRIDLAFSNPVVSCGARLRNIMNDISASTIQMLQNLTPLKSESLNRWFRIEHLNVNAINSLKSKKLRMMLAEDKVRGNNDEF